MKPELEEFIQLTHRLSLFDKFEAMALLAIQLPLDLIDMKDIIDILKENQDKHAKA